MPAASLEVLPLMVQLLSMSMSGEQTAPGVTGRVALDGTVGQRDCAAAHQAPALEHGGVAADGAIGQRGRE